MGTPSMFAMSRNDRAKNADADCTAAQLRQTPARRHGGVTDRRDSVTTAKSEHHPDPMSPCNR